MDKTPLKKMFSLPSRFFYLATLDFFCGPNPRLKIMKTGNVVGQIRKRAVRSAVAIAMIIGLAIESRAAAIEPQVPWSEGGVLRLELTVLNPTNKDLSRIQLELKVTNTGTNALVLDKELVAGFGFQFRSELPQGSFYDQSFYAQEREVTFKELSKLPKPTSNTIKDRFVSLAPGKSLSQTYDLSKPIRAEVDSHSAAVNSTNTAVRPDGVYYEALMRCRVPRPVKKIFIDVSYDRVWTMAARQFAEWYGRRAEDIGLWPGRAHSNTIVMERD